MRESRKTRWVRADGPKSRVWLQTATHTHRLAHAHTNARKHARTDRDDSAVVIKEALGIAAEEEGAAVEQDAAIVEMLDLSLHHHCV